MVKEYKNNRFLQRYENKVPDFDYLEREPKNTLGRNGRYILDDNGFWVNPDQECMNNATLLFAGDLLCQETQIIESELNDGYDFHYAFDLVSPILQNADLCIGNLETPVCDCAPYRTERYVSEQKYYNNAPSAYLEAVADAGFDLVTTANNHDLDAGAIALGATIDHCRELGLIQTGTFKDDCKRYQTVIVKGIKIAFTAFTTSHNLLAGNYSSEGRKKLLNTYDPSEAKQICLQAKEDGAQLVVVLMHWGKEYKHAPNEEQLKIARDLAEDGYGLIVGSHPHVVQRYEEITTSDQRKVPVIYSLGNFVSHQRKSRSYLSLMFKTAVSLKDDGSVDIDCSYIPCCTQRKLLNKKYVVLPLCEETGGLISQNDSADYLAHISENIGDQISADPFAETALPDPSSLKWKDSTNPRKDLPSLHPYEKRIKGIVQSKYPNAVKEKAFYLNDKEGSWMLIGLASTIPAIIIPNKIRDKAVSMIRKQAFAGNPVIKKINFPTSVTRISESACEGCSALEGVTLSKELKIINKYAFRNCTSLSSIVIRKKAKEIREGAFEGCINLRSIKIPRNVTLIDDTAFRNCPELIIYGLKNSYAQKYAEANGIPFRKLEDVDNLV